MSIFYYKNIMLILKLHLNYLPIILNFSLKDFDEFLLKFLQNYYQVLLKCFLHFSIHFVIKIPFNWREIETWVSNFYLLKSKWHFNIKILINPKEEFYILMQIEDIIHQIHFIEILFVLF